MRTSASRFQLAGRLPPAIDASSPSRVRRLVSGSARWTCGLGRRTPAMPLPVTAAGSQDVDQPLLNTPPPEQQILDLKNFNIHCVPKKVVHQIHGDNFVNSWRIFIILSLLESQVNFQQNAYNNFPQYLQYVAALRCHYLAKVRSSSFGISGRKCRWKRNILWFLNTHPILMYLTYLLTCFFFQFLVSVNVLCKSKQVLWTESAFSACLAWHSPDHHWQCNWRVAWTSSRTRTCASKRRTLRATIVTIFSHMTRDVSVFIKCDTIFILFYWKLPQFNTFNFRKVVRQHTEGMMGSIKRVLLEIYLAFQQWKFFLKIR